MSVDVLQAKIRKCKNPTMLGLDPTAEVVPPHLIAKAEARFGHTPKALAEAYRTFCVELMRQLKGFVPAVKLQSACFTVLGWEGVQVLQELLVQAKKLGYYVLLDTMRGDVGNIAALRAQSVFGGLQPGEETYCPYPADGITVSGYLGSDSIKPFLPYLKGDDPKNLFLIVRSSNRSAPEVQDLISGDRLVHTAMADLAMRWSTECFGKNGYSQIIAVVGTSHSCDIASLRRKYDRLFFMVPGYGAQGGNGKQASYAFDRLGHGAIVCAARSIIGAWREVEGSDGTDYLEAAQAAAERMKRNLATYVTVL